MPIDPDEFLKEGEQYAQTMTAAKRNGNGYARTSQGDSAWDLLFQQHPEGGGPFNGRDNALTKCVGFMRAKSFPYDAAVAFANWWNDAYCDPPMTQSEIHEKIGRKWYEWGEGGLNDLTPDELKTKKAEKPARVVLMSDDLLDLDASGGGMEWLIPNFLVKAGVHYVSAPAAGAKSWLMVDMARCVANGEHWLGEYPIIKGAVLYVDEEMGDRKMSARIRKLSFPRGIPFHYVGKQGIKMTDPEDRAFITEFCKKNDVALVIIDTLTGVMPGLRENESEHVSRLRAYFTEITNTGATILVAHHDRKGGQGDSTASHERMAGSRDFAAMADMAYALDKKGQYFHLTATKNRYLSEEEAINVEFCLEDDAEKEHVKIRVVGAEERLEKTRYATRVKITQAILAGGEMDTTELTEATKTAKATITETVKYMVDNGELAMQKVGRRQIYSFPAETPI